MSKKQDEKKFLGSKEASEFLGISIYTLYQYCHRRILPFHKPNNGKLYFNRQHLLEFVLNEDNLVKSESQIEQEALNTIVAGK